MPSHFIAELNSTDGKKSMQEQYHIAFGTKMSGSRKRSSNSDSRNDGPATSRGGSGNRGDRVRSSRD